MSHQVLLFTFKEGLLSRVAHDLRLHAERCIISREDDWISARFESGSIVVDGVMHGERLDPHGLDSATATRSRRPSVTRSSGHGSTRASSFTARSSRRACAASAI
jgi:hypothetical protein